MTDAQRQHVPDPLFTDFYELTMMQSYLREGMSGTAVFSLFVRRLPDHRNYLLACGLDGVLSAIEAFRLGPEDLRYLASLDIFSSEFLGWLRDFRFTGDIHALPEGTPAFGNEPILEVVAPLPEAQYFETFIINQIHLQTLLASKASRVVTAAQGRKVVDFGARRMHGVEAAAAAARAFHIAGVDATSNVSAARSHGLPLTGTMGHSYVQAHDREADAFRAFAKTFPGTTILIDTYDTERAARQIVDLTRSEGAGFRISAVRLDSGDLEALSRHVRRLLDSAGLGQIRILASGGLDEWKIARLVETGAPIDGFGVGTAMGVSEDDPALDIVYKLTEYNGKGRLKLSTAKSTLPGQKQVFRMESGGKVSGDTIVRVQDTAAGRPLLREVMRNGQRLAAGHDTLPIARGRAHAERALLPAGLLDLDAAKPPYAVAIGPALAADERQLREQLTKQLS
ncbi:MAG: nicotinate phosphoribosyltransferase [Alphaproteobacteria bacterium]|nr:nicotinate phosphoribosyltransferase [Alphaproteobacteria bacterium]